MLKWVEQTKTQKRLETLCRLGYRENILLINKDANQVINLTETGQVISTTDEKENCQAETEVLSSCTEGLITKETDILELQKENTNLKKEVFLLQKEIEKLKESYNSKNLSFLPPPPPPPPPPFVSHSVKFKTRSPNVLLEKSSDKQINLGLAIAEQAMHNRRNLKPYRKDTSETPKIISSSNNERLTNGSVLEKASLFGGTLKKKFAVVSVNNSVTPVAQT